MSDWPFPEPEMLASSSTYEWPIFTAVVEWMGLSQAEKDAAWAAAQMRPEKAREIYQAIYNSFTWRNQ